jgi:hypothetical protein
MAWEVEFTDDFEGWWNHLSAEEQESVNASVRLLQEKGPALGRPHVDTLSKMSKHSQMKELRIQHAGDPTAFCLRLTPSATRFCCWVIARRIRNGTSTPYQ